MAKTIPLDEQIVATLTGLCTSKQAAAVLTESEIVLRDLVKQADAADVASLSPLATAAEARKLRDQAADNRFEADRMEASVSALSARLADLKDAESRARSDAERHRVLKARDALAAEIAEQYPRAVATLTDLAKRISESDAECRGFQIESAESIGRSIPANFYIGGGPVMRLIDVRLPMPGTERVAWEHNPYSGWVWHGLASAEVIAE